MRVAATAQRLGIIRGMEVRHSHSQTDRQQLILIITLSFPIHGHQAVIPRLRVKEFCLLVPPNNRDLSAHYSKQQSLTLEIICSQTQLCHIGAQVHIVRS